MWVAWMSEMGLGDPFTWFGRQHRFAKYIGTAALEWVSNELLWISIYMEQSLFWHVYKHDIKMSSGVKCLLRKKQREAFPLK